MEIYYLNMKENHLYFIWELVFWTSIKTNKNQKHNMQINIFTQKIKTVEKENMKISLTNTKDK